MKIYLMDHTIVGHEDQFPRRRADLRQLLEDISGIEVVSVISSFDLIIAVTDKTTSGTTVAIAYQCSRGKVWYFYPRGTHVPTPIAVAINGHIQLPGEGVDQRAFPYDSTTDISSWVRSSLTPGGMLARFVTVPVVTSDQIRHAVA